MLNLGGFETRTPLPSGTFSMVSGTCQNFIYQAGAVFREKFTCTRSDD